LPGNPSTGRYRQTTNGNQVGQSFGVKFTCIDSGTPPLSTSSSATIRIAAAPPTPTPIPPTPTPTRVPAPGQCTLKLGQRCTSDQQCCAGICGPENLPPPRPPIPPSVCCLADGADCTTDAECCNSLGQGALCINGACVPFGGG